MLIDTILMYFLNGVTALFLLLIVICFIRAVKGPTIADRIVAVNMIGTLVIMVIAILTILLSEGWLADIAAVYAMISFLAVVVLTKIYLGVFREHRAKKEAEQ